MPVSAPTFTPRFILADLYGQDINIIIEGTLDRRLNMFYKRPCKTMAEVEDLMDMAVLKAQSDLCLTKLRDLVLDEPQIGLENYRYGGIGDFGNQDNTIALLTCQIFNSLGYAFSKASVSRVALANYEVPVDVYGERKYVHVDFCLYESNIDPGAGLPETDATPRRREGRKDCVRLVGLVLEEKEGENPVAAAARLAEAEERLVLAAIASINGDDESCFRRTLGGYVRGRHDWDCYIPGIILMGRTPIFYHIQVFLFVLWHLRTHRGAVRLPVEVIKMPVGDTTGPDNASEERKILKAFEVFRLLSGL
ncbi:hypothetical protein CPB83DRAFT_851352 [Crepidotus variabilis]|uniref:Uncharacterized protein n=1 Tax=Crepidotus variabilis TaxID=179855 RepID=A0A9P6EK17_9AGAR|nr:hypothetical protein CPB83DRAFT_851352 [Crepidotus variabilis]